MSNYDVRYKFTYDMFREANHLHRRRSIGAMLIFWIFFIIIPAVVVALVLFGLISIPFAGIDNFRKMVPFLSLLAGYALLPWLLRSWALRKAYRSNFPKHIDSSADIHLSFRDTEVTSQQGTSVHVSFVWPAFCRTLENRNLMMLYYSHNQFLCIPRQALLPEDWTALQAFIHSRVTLKAC